MGEATTGQESVPIVQASRMRQYFMPGDHIEFKRFDEEIVGHHTEPKANDLREIRRDILCNILRECAKAKREIPLDLLLRRVQDIFQARAIGKPPTETKQERSLFQGIMMDIIQFISADQSVRIDRAGSLEKDLRQQSIVKRQTEVGQYVKTALEANQPS